MAKPFTITDGRVVVRRIQESKFDIVFWDTHTIYVLDGKMRHIFHRWFDQRGFYTCNWAPFRQALRRKKNLTITEIYYLANEYGIGYTCNTRTLGFKGKKVEYIYD